MDPSPPSDGDFRLVRVAEPGAWGFAIFRADTRERPASAIAAGTLFSACPGLPQIRAQEGWKDYVAGRSEAAEGGFWQHFVRALPTTPTVTERTDPIFGRVYDHAYDDLTANAVADVGDFLSTAGAGAALTLLDGVTPVTLLDGVTPVTLTGSRIVRAVQTEDMGQGLNSVVVTTSANAQVSKTTDEKDEETGLLNPVTQTWTISATRPTGSPVGSDFKYTLVQPVEHNVWLATTRKASTLPASRAEALNWPTVGRLYWPAVLESYRFTQVSEDDRLTFKQLLSYNMRDPFASDVKITVRKWAQATPLDITPPAAMTANAIRVVGHRQSFSIPECLHGDFNYSEQVITVPNGYGYTYDNLTGLFTGLNLSLLTFHFSATDKTDWPETIVRTEQVFQRGIYLLQEETYYRPADYRSSVHTVTSRPWTTNDIWELPVEL